VAQGVRRMTLEQLGVLATVLSLVIGGGALYYAKRATRVSEQELELARQEALRHPKLELQDISLVDGQDSDDVIRTREAKEKWREAWDQAAEEDFESATYEQGFVAGGPALDRVTDAMKAKGEDYTAAQVYYDGPYPDLVLTLELRNMGRRVAKDVTGEVAIERSFLEPIDFPLFDGEAVDEPEYATPPRKEVKLRVGEVPPFPSEEPFVFKIALRKKNSGKTTIVVTFTTPEGDYLEARRAFDLR
jgi:hypothetical protein